MTDPKPPGEGGQPQAEKWYERTRYQVLLFAGGIVLFGLVWFVLDAYIDPKTSTQKKDLVQALGLITAGVAGAVGIFFTWRGQKLARKAQEHNQKNTLVQLENAQEQLTLTRQSQAQNQKNTQAQLENAQEELRLTRQGQITERFTKAIDQLGATNGEGDPLLEIRLGGIYALARIADNAADPHYWPVIEVLTAYVRANVPRQPKETSESDKGPECEEDLGRDEELTHQHERLDIQAILYILRHRKKHYGKGEDQPIWLAKTNLRNGDLRDMHLEEARLRGADLKGARLWRAKLRKARLSNAILERAMVGYAQLQQAELEQANLSEANLEWANLTSAKLKGADLRGANLTGADLTGAQGVTDEALEQEAKSLERATMPNGQKYEDWLKSKDRGEDGENGGPS